MGLYSMGLGHTWSYRAGLARSSQQTQLTAHVLQDQSWSLFNRASVPITGLGVKLL